MNKPKQKPYVVAIYAPYADQVKKKLKEIKAREGTTYARIVVKAILSL